MIRLKHARTLVGILGMTYAGLGLSQPIMATTSDGRQVQLNPDKTWEFVVINKDAAELEKLLLTVEKKFSKTRACKLGLRMRNTSNYFVKSIVPNFSAMIGGGNTKYETTSVEFTRIKPLRDEYKEIRFVGLSCDDIDYVKVHGGDRCTMGDLDKFGSTNGECIGRVKIVNSDKMEMRKQYP